MCFSVSCDTRLHKKGVFRVFLLLHPFHAAISATTAARTGTTLSMNMGQRPFMYDPESESHDPSTPTAAPLNSLSFSTSGRRPAVGTGSTAAPATLSSFSGAACDDAAPPPS